MPRRVILGLLGSEEMQKQNNGICFARMDRDRDYSQEMVKILQGRNDEPFVLALMYLEDIGKGELITDQARSRLVAMAITETTSALQWLANCAVTNHEGMPERLINSIPRMDARYSQRLIDVLQRNKMDGPWHEATSTALNAHPENIEWMVEKYRFLAVDVEESVKAYHRSLAVFENFADLFKTFLVPVIEVRERAMRSKPNDMEWIPVESYIDVIWSVVLPRMREVANESDELAKSGLIEMEPAYVAMNQSAVKRIRKYEGPRMDFDECIGTYRKGTPERIAFLYNLGQWAVFLADRISIPLRVLPDRISERKEEMDRVYSVIRESGLVAEANMPPEYVDGYFHGLYEYFLEAFDQMSVSDYTRGLVEDILAPGIPGRADDELGSAY